MLIRVPIGSALRAMFLPPILRSELDKYHHSPDYLNPAKYLEDH